jgi:hypothetical protein
MENAKNEVARLKAELTLAQAAVARQAQELTDVREELRLAKSPAEVRINAEARAVSVQPELIDVQVQAPNPGSRVFALGRGGVLVPNVWGKNDAEFFGAWMAYPKIPESVKAWLAKSWVQGK